WVVKLIDVYPEELPSDPPLGGYQLPIAMDIFRGRYRESFSRPSAIPSGKVERYRFALPHVNHVFLPGHRLMVQIQSSWFPLYDPPKDEQASGPAARARRPSGRDAKIAARTARSHAFVPYNARNIPYYEVLSTGGLELLENNADTILEEIGIDFRDDAESLKLCKDAGADVQGERVRFPRGMCRSIVRRSAPTEFTQYARNPARNVVIGGNRTVFAPAYGSPFVRSLDEGRRYARIEDFRNFVKLAYMATSLHHSGGTVCEPVDLPVNKRHFDMVYAHMKYSDKPYMGSVTHPSRALDT